MRADSTLLRELRRLHHSLANVPDAMLTKVVAVVDALEARGAADDVIAPLRPRLAQLRPPRPLRFARLLFLPLDPLIVPAPEWRQGSPTIPRSALPSLATTVRDAIIDEASSIDTMLRDCLADDDAVAVAAGRILWPMAAGILAQPGPSSDMMTARVAMLLGMTERLQALFAEAEIGVTTRVESLLPMVATAAAQGVDALAMLLALVLARLPEARPLLLDISPSLGLRGDEPMRTAIDQALAVLVDRLEKRSGIETLVIGSSLGRAAAEVRRILVLLAGLETGGEDARLKSMGQRLDACCRLRFATALEAEFAAALQAVGDAPGRGALARLEDTARGLHNLESEARQIASRETYDALLRQAAAMVQAGALSLIDRVRLVEILVGPDEALAMLEPATATP
jgi:hypothetical protein